MCDEADRFPGLRPPSEDRHRLPYIDPGHLAPAHEAAGPPPPPPHHAHPAGGEPRESPREAASGTDVGREAKDLNFGWFSVPQPAKMTRPPTGDGPRAASRSASRTASRTAVGATGSKTALGVSGSKTGLGVSSSKTGLGVSSSKTGLGVSGSRTALEAAAASRSSSRASVAPPRQSESRQSMSMPAQPPFTGSGGIPQYGQPPAPPPGPQAVDEVRESDVTIDWPLSPQARDFMARTQQQPRGNQTRPRGGAASSRGPEPEPPAPGPPPPILWSGYPATARRPTFASTRPAAGPGIREESQVGYLIQGKEHPHHRELQPQPQQLQQQQQQQQPNAYINPGLPQDGPPQGYQATPRGQPSYDSCVSSGYSPSSYSQPCPPPARREPCTDYNHHAAPPHGGYQPGPQLDPNFPE